MEPQLRQAILDELRRQAEVEGLELDVSSDEADVTISGRLDIDALVMVIAGSLAGGP